MFRQVLFVPLLATAIGAPFMLLSGPDSDEKKNKDDVDVNLIDLDLDSVVEDDTPLVYKPSSSLGEVFGFHLTPDQIKDRFENVTKSEIKKGLTLYRTSILTGHGKTDLVGAVTYQFDFRNNLIRIQFRGLSEDPVQMIEFAKSQFGFSNFRSDVYTPGSFSSFAGKLEVQPSTKFSGQSKINLEVRK